MIGRPQKVTGAMRERIVEIARQRFALRGLPSNKQLAREAGISERGVAGIMRRELVRLNEAPRGTIRGTPEEVADAVMREYGLDPKSSGVTP